jgi:hypothetical protein
MKSETRKAKKRRSYQKPRLRSFALTADEILAKGCKTDSPGPGFQGTGCASGGCFENGS